MRFNHDNYRSLNESINEVQNPQRALNEAQDYAALLEGVLVDLCEEFDLDIDAVMEMAQSAARHRESVKQGNAAYNRLNKARPNIGTHRGNKEYKQAGRDLDRVILKREREEKSNKVFGKGGKVLKREPKKGDYRKPLHNPARAKPVRVT